MKAGHPEDEFRRLLTQYATSACGNAVCTVNRDRSETSGDRKMWDEARIAHAKDRDTARGKLLKMFRKAGERQ